MSDDGISWLQNALWPAEKGKKGDEVVIVTGCSSGIGERIMIELAHQGYTVFATTRTGEVPTIPGVYGFKLDVSEDASIRDFVRNVTDKLETFKKPLRALINNAGVAVVRPAELISRDVLLNSLNVNFVGPAELSRLLLPLLKASKGRIINISSMAAWMHPPWYGSYCAAKAAISAWSDCLRREIQASGVKVSVIEPGAIATRMTEQMLPSVAFSDAIREEFPIHKQYDHRPFTRLYSMGSYGYSSPDGTVRSVVHALESRWPWRRYYVTWDAWLLAMVTWIVPEMMIDAAFQLVLRPALPVE